MSEDQDIQSLLDKIQDQQNELADRIIDAGDNEDVCGILENIAEEQTRLLEILSNIDPEITESALFQDLVLGNDFDITLPGIDDEVKE